MKIFKNVGSITNLEEYHEIYNDVYRKHKPRIRIEKYRLNKKLFHWRKKPILINKQET